MKLGDNLPKRFRLSKKEEDSTFEIALKVQQALKRLLPSFVKGLVIGAVIIIAYTIWFGG